MKNLKITGRNYRERQAALRNLAIDYSNNFPVLSMGELIQIQGFFERNGRRYGLLREFHENAIC